MTAAGRGPRRECLERFYAAIQRRDAGELESVIDTGFAPEVVLRLPASLPYGGVYEGRESLRSLLLQLIRARDPIVQPDGIRLRRLIADGDQAAAELAFPWKAPGAEAPIEMSAIEWFRFRDDEIVEMDVAYGDTVRCAEELARAARG